MNSEGNTLAKNPITAVVDEMTPRKSSKRMEKVRQASLIQKKAKSSLVVEADVVHGSSDDVHEKPDKQQVSLKNIVFEGSQRRMSALHPSQKLSMKGSNGNIEPHEFKVASIQKMSMKTKNNVEAGRSQDNVMSE